MLSHLDPLISEWFSARLGEPTEPQRLGWPEIHAGARRPDLRAHRFGKDAGGVPDSDRPAGARRPRGHAGRRNAGRLRLAAKALSNDVQKNLDAPLAEISELAARKDSVRAHPHGSAHRRHARTGSGSSSASGRRTSW